MIFSNKDDDSQDFFDGPDIEVPEKEEPAPQYTPDDPKYWEQEESPWDHLRPRTQRRVPKWLWLVGALVIIMLCLVAWLRYLTPYVDEATQYGYVDSIELRGTIFKTYEGTLIPYKEFNDTTRIYTRDFTFTAANKGIAKRIMAMRDAAIPVRVGYRRYHATLPWRGASKIIVTSVDTADVARILPPDFAPVRR